MAGAADAVTPGHVVEMRPRNYQLEMLDASMKENIIVAMDTGSGKTHIAVLRIMKELERCDPDKLVWFMAPTIELCIQQHKVVSSSILDVNSRTLTGLDNVDLWTNQPIWDAALRDVRIVFSTHAILADALSHGFVKISQLALVVFDEAHHCRARHPANKILQDFYHPALGRYGPEAVPDILGLTASPAVKDPKELQVVESNMNAVCKTPREHRSELLEHTNCPELLRLVFPPPKSVSPELQSLALKLLIKHSRAYDIEDDPYVRRLRENLPYSKDKLWDAIRKGKTYCNEQIKKFVSRSVHIAEELGPWATEYFVHTSIDQFKNSGNDSSMMTTWDDDEKAYLVDFLSKIPLPDIQLDPAGAYFPVSPKIKCLLSFLDQRYHPEFSGLIFVKQRIAAAVLAQVLSVHPLTKDRFRCAAYVGLSGHSNRKGYIGDPHDLRSQRDTVEDFRSGRKNLIICTDVLEEGIDISACNMVICYDKSPNMKSYVQRRGRARQGTSTYALMFPEDDEFASLDKWKNLEASMVETYQDEERERREDLDDDDDEEVPGSLFIESTRAHLKPHSAVAHLHHFCDVLPSEPYVDNRPVFKIDNDDQGSRRRTVILPSSVHPSVRCTPGAQGWRTKKAAMKDAAFQAYKALYEFGLVNDNLLPLAKKPELKLDDTHELPPSMEVSEQYDPWVELAQAWLSPDMHQHQITVRQNGVLIEQLSMTLTVPALLPEHEPLTLYLDEETTFTLSFGPARSRPSVTQGSAEVMRAITALFFETVSRKFANVKKDFVALFAPDIPETELELWLDTNKRREPASDVYSHRHNYSPLEMGIVRDCMNHSEALIFRRWVVSEETGDSSSAIQVECAPFPRRRNLLSRQTLSEKPADSTHGEDNLATNARILPAETCTIDILPFAQSVFGLFISAIMEKLGTVFTATKLASTILKDVRFSSIRHVITAITAPQAMADENYQRYEFFGDSVLKFTVSCQLFFEYPNWHEGYLSERRDAIVQNPRLTRAALDLGLEAFIITKVFSPRKWSPPTISETLQTTPAQRTMSAKVLADVVEALVGAAYMDSGMQAAQTCVKQFLPDIDLQKIDTKSIPGPDPSNHVMNRKIPQHIGYNFNNEALLKEALTHPSCDYDHHTQSYQRLEFLGDAVLDIIIVTALSKHPVEIPQGTMTQIKAAVVNANLLGFFCMEFALPEQTTDVQLTPGKTPTLVQGEKRRELWRFMRFRDQVLASNRDAAVERHRLLRDDIAQSLLLSTTYPWELLSRLNADKFFSDLVESILGGIFVDSNGNLAACEHFIEQIGILPYLRRILIDDVDVVHPRNTAQRLAKSSRLSFGVQKGRSDTEDPASSGAGGGNGEHYSCMASLDDVQIAAVGGCSSREEAEVKAANAAVAFLRERE